MNDITNGGPPAPRKKQRSPKKKSPRGGELAKRKKPWPTMSQIHKEDDHVTQPEPPTRAGVTLGQQDPIADAEISDEMLNEAASLLNISHEELVTKELVSPSRRDTVLVQTQPKNDDNDIGPWATQEREERKAREERKEPDDAEGEERKEPDDADEEGKEPDDAEDAPEDEREELDVFPPPPKPEDVKPRAWNVIIKAIHLHGRENIPRGYRRAMEELNAHPSIEDRGLVYVQIMPKSNTAFEAWWKSEIEKFKDPDLQDLEVLFFGDPDPRETEWNSFFAGLMSTR